MDRLLKLLDSIVNVVPEVWLKITLETIQHIHKIGLPPKIEEKNSFRHWLMGLLPVLDTIAEATKTDIDNQAAVLVRVCIENDEAWDAFYNLIYAHWFSEETSAGDSVWFSEETRVGDSVQICAAQAGISPALVISIVRLLIKVTKLLKS